MLVQPKSVANTLYWFKGSLTSYNATAESSNDDQQNFTEDDVRQPRSPSSSVQQQVLSPEPISSVSKLKRPSMTAKLSSKFQAPYKGQEFSADDDPSEYESNFTQRKPSVVKPMLGSGHTLRRQSSTLRRRATAQPTSLPRVDSQGDTEDESEVIQIPSQTLQEDSPDTSGDDGVAKTVAEVENDDAELSDAESFTLRDRQQAINETHPFGIRIWKPALYKKNRSVEKTAEGDIHSSPGARVSQWLWVFNILWTILFGWWLAIAAVMGAFTCFLLGFTPGAMDYGRVLWGLAWYLFYPFGQFVRLEQDEAYAAEDEGEGRSITEYEQWQSGDLEDGRLFFGPLTSRSITGRRRASMDSTDENDSLLGRTRRTGSSEQHGTRSKRRLFGRGEWNFGRVIFFIFFYFLITPLLLMASLVCWFLVFWIPMARVTLLLFYHLRRHPLALSFHYDTTYSRGSSSPSSAILLCTYRAIGSKYWKYTIDGTNIFLINLIGVVLFAIFDYWVLDVALGLKIWLVNPGFVFALALFSIIPLAYFIGQAVASISAQSSMGVGAAINAFFSTIVEVFLYCVALKQGKGQLVEGSIIGSIFAGILFLPGLSMCFGAIKRKTQRFNVKSAGVTSTMLLFAVIAAFGPTLFYQIYGSVSEPHRFIGTIANIFQHELNCYSCISDSDNGTNEDCRRCYYSQVPAVHDRFFHQAVQPYCWFAAVLLFLSYVIGLWFTLRTHAAVIWNIEIDEKKPQVTPTSNVVPNGSILQQQFQSQLPAGMKNNSTSSGGSVGRNAIRESQLYKRILGQSLKQAGLNQRNSDGSRHVSTSDSTAQAQGPNTPYIVPPKSSGGDSATIPDHAGQRNLHIAGLSEEDNNNLVRTVADMAATAATVAARDVTRGPRKTSLNAQTSAHNSPRPSSARYHDDIGELVTAEVTTHTEVGGHDAPNWSRLKSAIILLGATILYAIIAEILVNTVDVVLQSVDIDEKFLGITLFALVPNTTEFLV